jgi:sigma-E factor negative regulatory protein RseC
VEKGDRVVLSMGNGMILKSAFIVYMVPLIALIAGYYIGKALMDLFNYKGNSELFPALFGFFLLFLSFMAIRWFDRKKRDDKRYRVSIKKLPS